MLVIALLGIVICLESNSHTDKKQLLYVPGPFWLSPLFFLGAGVGELGGA